MKKRLVALSADLARIKVAVVRPENKLKRGVFLIWASFSLMTLPAFLSDETTAWLNNRGANAVSLATAGPTAFDKEIAVSKALAGDVFVEGKVQVEKSMDAVNKVSNGPDSTVEFMVSLLYLAAIVLGLRGVLYLKEHNEEPLLNSDTQSIIEPKNTSTSVKELSPLKGDVLVSNSEIFEQESAAEEIEVLVNRPKEHDRVQVKLFPQEESIEAHGSLMRTLPRQRVKE